MSKLVRLRTGAWLAGFALLGVMAVAPRAVHAVNTCNGVLTIDYVSGPNFAVTDSVLRVRLTLGADGITGGTKQTVNRVRFELDCTEGGGGVPCTNLGAVVEYEGDSLVSTTCQDAIGDPIAWSSNVPLGGSAINEIVLTPSSPIDIPAGSLSGVCVVEFDIKVLNQTCSQPSPTVNDPCSIMQFAGYITGQNDAVCDNMLSSGSQQSGAIPICNQPSGELCDDGNECTTDTCDTGTGMCVFTPVDNTTPCTTDENGNPVTVEQCNQLLCTDGICENQPDSNLDSTPCDSTPDVPGDCFLPGCEAGVCVATHIAQPASTACDNNGGVPVPNDPNDCFGPPGCNDAGVCDPHHIEQPASTACSVDSNGDPVSDTTGDCFGPPGCEAGGICNPQHTALPPSTACDNNDGTPVTPVECNTPGCEAGGVCSATHLPSPDSTACTDTTSGDDCAAGCEAGTCVQTHACVQPGGCRITGGRNLSTADGRLTGGGQVGAPCGCIGCFDEFDAIQGNWTMRRDKHRGRFKATDFNSLVCGCEACDIALQTNVKKLDGNLCNDNSRVCGPTPPNAPANLACFSGTGLWSPDGRNKNSVPVAYRVEVEDHGEPGGTNQDGPPDEYRIWIYVPQAGETVKGLAVDICCENTPTGNDPDARAIEEFGAGRAADVFDGGELTHGNLQIHNQIGAHIGQCPVPNGECPATLP